MSSPPTAVDPLHNWEEWQLPFTDKPVLISQLSNGRTNHSYLIEADKQRWVLRRNSKESARLGINHQCEALILQQVSKAGIAPNILYCSPEKGILISEFIDGQHWQTDTLANKDKQSKLKELLQHTHALKIDIPAFDYEQHLYNYWRQLELDKNLIPDTLHITHEIVKKWLEQYTNKRTLCHHDPNPQNILEYSDRLYLIDWEYAGYGWPEFDYAALSVEWEIQTVELTEHMESMKTFYVHLCDVWTLLNLKSV